MQITLFKYSGLPNTIFKGLPTKGYSINGSLKSSCSIADPLIDFEFRKDNYPDFIADFNYAFITEFNRYYFITNKEIINNRLIRLSMHVDVLKSFASVIESSLCYVNRVSKASEYNVNVRDEMRSFEEQTENSYTIIESENESDIDVLYNTQNSLGDGKLQNNCVVTFINASEEDYSLGGNDLPLEGLIDNTLPCPPDLGLAIGIDDANSNAFRITDPSMAGKPINLASCSATTAQALNFFLSNNADAEKAINSVISLRAYPFDVKKYQYYDFSSRKNVDQTTNSLSIGKVKTPTTLGTFYGASHKFLKIAQFNFLGTEDRYSKSRWRLYENKYEIYLPFKGWIELPSEKVVGNVISVYYLPDFVRSTTYIYIINNHPELIYSDTCDIGIDLPLNQTNAQEIKDTFAKVGTNTALKTLTGALAIGLGMSTGNVMKTIGGVGAIASGLGDVVSTGLTTHKSISTSIHESNDGYFNSMKPIIRITHKTPVTEDSDLTPYINNFGLPCQKWESIRNLVDDDYFIKCGTCRIPLDGMSKAEHDEIVSLLQSGVYVGYKQEKS